MFLDLADMPYCHTSFHDVMLFCSFMLDLRHENRVEYNKKIKAMAESLGFSVSKHFGFLT